MRKEIENFKANIHYRLNFIYENEDYEKIKIASGNWLASLKNIKKQYKKLDKILNISSISDLWVYIQVANREKQTIKNYGWFNEKGEIRKNEY